MDISLLSKKTIAKLGSKVNDHNNNGNSIKLSDFALKQMKKMGWNEGEGLGRHSDGIKHHIIIKKRENSTGLGSDVVDINSNGPTNDVDVDESWWNKTFSNNLKNMKIKNLNGKIKKIKKEKHDKKRKRSSCRTNGDDDDVDNDDNDDANDRMRLLDSDAMDNPSFEDLFKATGGKRLGMRARSEQKGKLLRTECMEGSNVVVASTGLEKLSTSVTHVNVSVVVDHKIVIDTNNKEKKLKKAKKSKNKIDDVDDIDALDTIDGSDGQDQEECNDHDKIKKPKKLKKSKRNSDD